MDVVCVCVCTHEHTHKHTQGGGRREGAAVAEQVRKITKKVRRTVWRNLRDQSTVKHL